MTKEKAAAMNAGSGTIKSLINDGYVNVYFEFNSTNPEVYSYEAINYLITYMRQNPSAKASLTGYADEIGNPQYNASISAFGKPSQSEGKQSIAQELRCSFIFFIFPLSLTKSLAIRSAYLRL